ncbi:MAG: GNAT family N-acetyltransferase [Candidatus Peribacteria bacterium]|jgi:L-amino acid N-acyltransferase YncA|nr:GNAT family N-acetyltransferase [Candidatus Peribacteria bacterium]
MVIRLATSADAEQLLDINIKARKDGYQGLVDQAYLDSREVTPARIQAAIERISKNTRFFLVYENDQHTLLGFINGGIPRDEGMAYTYEVYSFYVHPHHQRTGIGSQLWSAFREKIHYQPFYLWTFAKSRGEQFYLKYGGTSF